MGAHIVKDTDEKGRERTTIYCSRDRKPKVCHYCQNPGVRLCDFKVEGGTNREAARLPLETFNPER